MDKIDVDDIPVLNDQVISDEEALVLAHHAALGEALLQVGVEGWIYYHNARKIAAEILGGDYDDSILP